MRIRDSFLLLQLGSIMALAQENSLERVRHAALFNERGQFRAALNEVEPLLHQAGAHSKDPLVGVAWDVRGLALQNLDDDDEARRSYESAIEILRGADGNTGQYAAALDNLGSLKAQIGEIEESRQLRLRALSLYERVGDHLGLARVKNSLVLIFLAKGNRTEARRYLEGASQDLSQVKTPAPGDVASNRTTECLVDLSERHFQDALHAINESIDLWRINEGETFYLMSTGYSLRGQAYEGLGEHEKAIEDFQKALAVLEQSEFGKQSLMYLSAQIGFAKALRHSGKKEEAAQMESTVRRELELVRRRECSDCTVSAHSFR